MTGMHDSYMTSVATPAPTCSPIKLLDPIHFLVDDEAATTTPSACITIKAYGPASMMGDTSMAGLELKEEDANGYLNAFQAILRDTQWFQQKLQDGYIFTLLCGDPKILRPPFNAPSEDPVNLTLLVIKNGYFVPCTQDFLPTRCSDHQERLLPSNQIHC